ncbi:MAG: hypothetical protein ACYC38_14045 [Eubacteriales bacterium]|nr:hypothetical protein [Deltaproteobacteria bacterium]
MSKMSKWKLLTSLVIFVIAAAISVSGCSNTPELNSPKPKQTEDTTIISKNVNNQFWDNVLTYKIKAAGENFFTVLGYSNVEEKKWGTFNIYTTPQTVIWCNGKPIPYSQAANKLKENDNFDAVIQRQQDKIIAEEIYGPVFQVWGRIKEISGNQLAVQELKYTESPDTLKHPTGRTLYMLYDSRTLFDPGCSPESLKPGAIIQSTASGCPPDGLLIHGISIYTPPPPEGWRKESPSSE